MNTMDERLYSLFLQLGESYAARAACHLPEDQSREKLEEILEVYVGRGNLEGVCRVAAFLNRTITLEELKRIFTVRAKREMLDGMCDIVLTSDAHLSPKI
jgi:hypothetical protein